MTFGPSRGELWFRLAVSVAGLGLMVGAILRHGVSGGPALVEVIGVAGIFFGGSAVWSGLRLWRGRRT